MEKYLLSAFADEADASLKGQIEALKQNGIKYLEIRNIDSKGILSYDYAEIKAISKSLYENEIKISAVGSPIGKILITEPFEPHIELFKKALEAAEILGTKKIRMFSFFIPRGEEAERYRDEVFEGLNKILELSEKSGISCCLENEKEVYGENFERTYEILKKFKGRLKGIFDPANFVQCGERPKEFFSKLAPFTDYLHIKDALLSDGKVMPAGLGDGDIEEILVNFYNNTENTANAFLTLEPHLSEFPGYENLKDNHSIENSEFSNSRRAFDYAFKHLLEILNKNGLAYE